MLSGLCLSVGICYWVDMDCVSALFDLGVWDVCLMDGCTAQFTSGAEWAEVGGMVGFGRS